MDINKEDKIIAYLEQTLTKEERACFEEEMDISPQFKKEVEDLTYIWNLTNRLVLQKKIDTQKRKKKMLRKIECLRIGVKSWDFFRTAAAILLPILVLSHYFSSQPEGVDTSVNNEQIEVSSAYGLVSKIALPDGSKVWLNSGSTLTYPRYFSDSVRQVLLNGEAYFDVAATPNNRFEVLIPGKMLVCAYGTEFNINAYADENEIQALLAKGSIAVSNTNNHCLVHLMEGEAGTITSNSPDIKITTENIYATTAWREGKMVFRRERMDVIAKKLARHFNVEVELQGKFISNYEYSATFVNETLSDILNLLEKSAPIECIQIEPTQQKDLSYQKKKVIIRDKK